MISFDDYGGSGGDVDLSPIYASLGVLKSNTLMIWDYVSTITGGSMAYLESFRMQGENYMYNITGELPKTFSNNKQIIKGVMNLQSGTCNQSILSIDYADSINECWFGANSMTFNVDIFSQDVVSTFRNLSINANSILNFACLTGNVMNLNACTISDFYFKSLSIVNITADSVLGVSNQFAAFESLSVLNLNCSMNMYNAYVSILNGMITIAGGKEIILQDNSYIDMKGMYCQGLSVVKMNSLVLNVLEVDMLTASTLSNLNAHIGAIQGGSLSNVYSFYGNVENMLSCTQYSGTLDLSGQSFVGNVLNSVSGTLNYSFMKNCTFENCNNLSINLIGMSDVSFKDCKGITVNYFDNYRNTFNNCTSLSVKIETIHTSVSFTNINSLTYNAILISTNQTNSTPLQESSQWINRLVIRNLPFMGTSYESVILTMMHRYGISYTHLTGLGQLEQNFEDYHYYN